MKSKVIAIANHKGGVGKTTSVGSIGAGLALKGYKVLMIDLDAQMNLTYTFTHLEETEDSIYSTLVKETNVPIYQVGENLFLSPASLELAKAEIEMSTLIARERILKHAIEPIKNQYDYILLDCPPSLGVITTNALVAADELYIPLTAETLPYKGLKMLEETVGEIKKRVNPNLSIGGVFFTRYGHRNLNKEVVNIIENTFGNSVFKTKIRENISLAEMPLKGGSIFEYDKKCNGAKDYMSLVEEIINK